MKTTWYWEDINDVVVLVERNDAFHVTMLDLEVGFPGDVVNVLVLLGVVAQSLRAMLVSKVLL